MATITHSGSHTHTHTHARARLRHVRLVSVPGGASVSIRSSWLQPQTQYLVLQLGRRLAAGQTYRLYAEFTGELADDLSGFYRTQYQEHGVTRYLLRLPGSPGGDSRWRSGEVLAVSPRD